MLLEEFLSREYNLDILKLSSNKPEKREYLNSIFDKELLEDIFYNKKYTVYNFQEILRNKGFNNGAFIRKYCKKYNVKLPNYKEASKLAYKKRCKTNLTRFGAINPLSKGTIPYKKRNNSVKEKYGVENVFQLDDTKEKSAETCIRKYGAPTYTQSIYWNKTQNRISYPHLLVSTYLEDNNINHINEKRGIFMKYNDYLKRIYSPEVDIFIPDDKVIEIYGTYYHASPKRFKSSDLIRLNWRNDELITVQEVWDFDYYRQKQIESFGMTMLVLWEDEIMTGAFKEKINALLR